MTGQQDRNAKLIEALRKGLGIRASIVLFNAEVKSIQGESCTVAVGDLELTDVRLKATINEASDYLLPVPKTGSMVLCGDLSGGDLRDVCVLKVDELERIEYKQNGLEFIADSSDRKVSLKNSSVSLKSLFESVADILKTIKVFTPSGPSGTPLTPTVLKIQQFETALKQLLK